MSQAFVLGRCPVCNARFRQQHVCSRCGAELGQLMQLMVEAYLLRQAARDAMLSADVTSALKCAVLAQELCRTEQGERLLLLARARDLSELPRTPDFRIGDVPKSAKNGGGDGI